MLPLDPVGIMAGADERRPLPARGRAAGPSPSRDGRLEELARENALLRQKVDALVRRLFGARSERLDPGQLLLLLQGTEAPVLSPPAPPPRASAGARPPRPRRRARLPEHLPVVEEVLDPEAVRACPGAWRRVGEEVSEQLDYEPGRFYRRRLVRPKYVSRRGGGMGEASAFLIAPLPAGLLERGLAAPGLLAHVLVSKYADHLPLYRQEQIYRQRHGVHLPRATLARWVELAADWLRPVCEAMRRDVLSGGYVQVDETPVRYLCPGLGRAAQGYLWTCARPGGDVIFDWHTGRGSGSWSGSCPPASPGCCSATVTGRIAPSPKSGGRTRGDHHAGGLLGARAPQVPRGAGAGPQASWAGCWDRSASYTAPRPACGPPGPDRACGRRPARPRAGRWWCGCTVPWSSSKLVASCPAAF